MDARSILYTSSLGLTRSYPTSEFFSSTTGTQRNGRQQQRQAQQQQQQTVPSGRRAPISKSPDAEVMTPAAESALPAHATVTSASVRKPPRVFVPATVSPTPTTRLANQHRPAVYSHYQTPPIPSPGADDVVGGGPRPSTLAALPNADVAAESGAEEEEDEERGEEESYDEEEEANDEGSDNGTERAEGVGSGCENQCVHSRAAIVQHLQWQREVREARQALRAYHAAVEVLQQRVGMLEGEKADLIAQFAARVAKMERDFHRQQTELRQEQEEQQRQQRVAPTQAATDEAHESLSEGQPPGQQKRNHTYDDVGKLASPLNSTETAAALPLGRRESLQDRTHRPRRRRRHRHQRRGSSSIHQTQEVPAAATVAAEEDAVAARRHLQELEECLRQSEEKRRALEAQVRALSTSGRGDLAAHNDLDNVLACGNDTSGSGARFSTWKERAAAALAGQQSQPLPATDTGGTGDTARAIQDTIQRCRSALQDWKSGGPVAATAPEFAGSGAAAAPAPDKQRQSPLNAPCRRCAELMRALLDKERQMAVVAAERTRYKHMCERLRRAEDIRSKPSSSSSSSLNSS